MATLQRKNIMYFLGSGKRYKISEADLLNKLWKELEYVQYLLQVKDVATIRWSERINQTIILKQKGIKRKYVFSYVP